MKLKEFLTLLTGLAVAGATAQAQYTPVPLTPESFTFDIVVERDAAKPPARATTASFDGGTNNTGNTFYEMGFNAANPATGLPGPGTFVSNANLPVAHDYQMPASYTANNTLLVNDQIPTGTLTLNTPAPYTALSLLATSGGGAAVLNYTVTFADDSTEVGAATITVPDWFNGANAAIITMGRVNTQTRVFANVNEQNPRVYSVDIPLTETTKAVKSITLTRVSGGRTGVFALSGAATAGGAFSPIAISGFNKDMIVEAAAEQARTAPLGATTGTMDAGALNTGNTWYERGWLTQDLGPEVDRSQTGLPAAGSTFTSQTFPDHTYQMPASYVETPNAVIISSLLPSATLTPVTPIAATGLSFLGGSGNGAIGLNYTLNHQDGTTQTGTIIIPDWFNAQPVALTASGRVDVGNGIPNNVGSTNPRLYGVDIFVVNQTSPITSIALTHATGTGRTAIMAVSATAGPVRPLFATEPNSFTVLEGGSGQLSATVAGTEPFTYQWQKLVNGNWENVTDNARVTGANTSTLNFQNISFAEFGDYRLQVTNASGTSTSRTVRVNIVSTKTDVTIPSDIVTMVGGSAPAGEAVANAINDTTQKYLNYGLPDGNTAAPFEGPVGLQIELSEPAIITGLRMYTANDATERDPVGWQLLATSDPAATPETFQVIASGNFNLPLDRNAAGQPIDPLARANQEVSFANSQGYPFYRLMILNTRNSTTANSMQFGEVEFLGTFGTGSPQLSIVRNADGTITITSSQAGTLQSTTDLSTTPIPWTDVGPISEPVTLPTTGAMRFFRVTRPQ